MAESDILEESRQELELQAEEVKEQFLAYSPRDYQLQVLERARHSNTIAFLDTGTGKTYIAIMLLKECAGKAVFLAPTRALVLQQGLVARKMGLNSGIFQGRKYDSMASSRWKQKLQKHSVFFLTPQLFLNNLRFGYFNVSDFQLLIFDECHWCYGSHPYSNIMREFVYPLANKPMIFGMTASPVTSKLTGKSALLDKIEELADALECSFAPVDRSSVDLVANKPVVQIERFTEQQIGIDLVMEVQRPLQETVLGQDEHEEFEEVLSVLSRDSRAIYDLLGRYPLSLYIRDMANRVESKNLKKALLRLGAAGNDKALVSSRYKKLKAIIFSHFVKVQDRKAKAIVFTERRVVAYYLARLLEEDQLFISKELKTSALVGINANGKFDVTRMTDRAQDFTLVGFRSDLVNILVATSVVEEGLDVPSCDLVIRFESFSSNLRSYVQSRGRARQIDSKFFLLVDEKDDQTDQQRVAQFDQAIEFLKAMADAGVEPRFTPKPALEHFAVEETGAKISINWSKNYLDELCMTLKTDAFTEKKPEYVSEYYQPRTCPLTEIGGWERAGFLGIVKVPKDFRILETFSEQLYQTSDEAKASAALHVLRLMYEKKLLNSHLRAEWLSPNDTTRELIPILSVSQEVFGPRRGPTIKLGKKLVTCLPQDTPLYTATAAFESPLSLYHIAVQPAYTDFENYSLALLSPIRLNTEPFLFYPGNLTKNKAYPLCGRHEKQTSPSPDFCPSCNRFAFWAVPREVGEVRHSREELGRLKWFHSLLMASLDEKLGELFEALASGRLSIPGVTGDGGSDLMTTLLCVPWNSSKEAIDWEVVDNTTQYLRAKLAGSPMAPVQSSTDFVEYLWTVVQAKKKPHLYAVTEISTQGLDTAVEKKNKKWTVREYYASKGKELEEQTVFLVKNVGKFRNANWPLVGKRVVGILPVPIGHLSPFPIPLPLMQFGRVVPTIICQMQRKLIYGNLGREYGIASKSVQLALTCTSANEGYDYQRLETLGDSVLKYRATRFFFLSQPEAHEGILTKHREDHSSNAYLYNVSVKKELYRYINVLPFSLRAWVPPGLEALYQSVKADRDDSEEEENEIQQPNADLMEFKYFMQAGYDQEKVELDPGQKVADISNKQLADVVEALIGAAYIEGGLPLAEEIIKKLDILPPGKRLVREMNARRDFSELESRLGITFKSVGWYVEAFLHDSTNEQRSYQRLECLGDALLDLIVVEYFYEKYREASPGALSKLKSQMNNNLRQACFAVQLNLIPYIQYASPDISEALQPIQASPDLFLSNAGAIHTVPEKTFKLLADVFEALFGAIVMDYDYATAKEVFYRVAGAALTAEASPESLSEHPHSDFFEWAQARHLSNIKIHRTVEKQPHRNVENYCVEVFFEGKIMGKYVTKNKLEASEKACLLAKKKIEKELEQRQGVGQFLRGAE